MLVQEITQCEHSTAPTGEHRWIHAWLTLFLTYLRYAGLGVAVLLVRRAQQLVTVVAGQHVI